jgi:hypothetical protein
MLIITQILFANSARRNSHVTAAEEGLLRVLRSERLTFAHESSFKNIKTSPLLRVTQEAPAAVLNANPANLPVGKTHARPPLVLDSSCGFFPRAVTALRFNILSGKLCVVGYDVVSLSRRGGTQPTATPPSFFAL